MKEKKTNAMRILEESGISFTFMSYPVDESDLSGMHVAAETGQDPDTVFKTLVLKGEPKGYFVCCIPVNQTLDLKKAAKVSGNKRCEMIAMKDLKAITGYIRGGCSPIGMKKEYPTFLEESACLFDAISLSAGIRGEQMIVNAESLARHFGFELADLCL